MKILIVFDSFWTQFVLEALCELSEVNLISNIFSILVNIINKNKY